MPQAIAARQMERMETMTMTPERRKEIGEILSPGPYGYIPWEERDEAKVNLAIRDLLAEVERLEKVTKKTVLEAVTNIHEQIHKRTAAALENLVLYGTGKLTEPEDE